MAAEDLIAQTPTGKAIRVATKVPEMTAYFWITKVLTTGMGEAASDYLGNRLGTAIAMPLAATGFVLALVLQLRRRAYVAWVYWLAVVMVSVFGTMAADGVHNGAGVPYAASTVVFLLLLAAILAGWQRSEGTLSVHSIHTRRREVFYWATVVATFALGTAAGDMTASTLHLGYLYSWLVFAGIIAIPALGFWRFKLNAILAFWFAYIATRPLGASVADWLAVPRRQGGIGWGTGVVTLVMTVAILAFVAYLAVTHADVDPDVDVDVAADLDVDPAVDPARAGRNPRAGRGHRQPQPPRTRADRLTHDPATAPPLRWPAG